MGVYVHFPWCRRRCDYCDFAIAVAPEGEIPVRAYTDAVLRELELRRSEVDGAHLATLYFGGGTPALWAPEQLARVVDALAAAVPGRPDETTLECNPADVSRERLAAWRDLGITRLSIGLQSLSSRDLAVLGRPVEMGHDLAPIERAIDGGFEVSADVIAGIPGAGDPAATARALAERAVPHISVYELTVEPRTPLAASVRRGELAMPPEERLAEIYTEIHHTLAAAGYEHYEVSSYALPGHRARHNQGYWNGRECLALGNSAASLIRIGDGARRRTNARSAAAYLRGAGAAPAETETLGAEDLRAERRWLGLRTLDGVERELFDGLPGVVERLIQDGLAECVGDRITPTLKGFLCGDEVARRVLSA